MKELTREQKIDLLDGFLDGSFRCVCDYLFQKDVGRYLYTAFPELDRLIVESTKAKSERHGVKYLPYCNFAWDSKKDRRAAIEHLKNNT